MRGGGPPARPTLFIKQDEPLYEKQQMHFTLHAETTVTSSNRQGFPLLGGRGRLTSKTDMKLSVILRVGTRGKGRRRV